ncbi:MAG: hypothetical protein KMY55_06470, partial [Dethiosulfatibacter sp.]|nr:hypothetical protein [Dethiosulfatibacter sp.]
DTINPKAINMVLFEVKVCIGNQEILNGSSAKIELFSTPILMARSFMAESTIQIGVLKSSILAEEPLRIY